MIFLPEDILYDLSYHLMGFFLFQLGREAKPDFTLLIMNNFHRRQFKVLIFMLHKIYIAES